MQSKTQTHLKGTK